MIKVGVCGAGGRMGSLICRLAYESSNFELCGAIESEKHKNIGNDLQNILNTEGKTGIYLTSNYEEVVKTANVIIDFSNPSATLELISVVKNNPVGLVIGTTGFDEHGKKQIEEIASLTPVVFSPNMSVGVNLLFKLVEKATEVLGNSFETEIIEIHHNKKKDAPSGTALRFAEIIASKKGKVLNDIAVFGRHGIVGPRKPDEMGILSLRIADVVGEHTIIFGSSGERIEFTHKCTSRESFARGALRAAEFVVDKVSGLYTMEDVLGLKDV